MATADSTYIDITAASLRRLKPESTEYIRRDRDLVGFAVRVKPTGSAALFVEARVAGTGRQRRQTVWTFEPDATIEDKAVKAARAEAMSILAEWKAGHDTVAAKAGELPTVQSVLDRYITVRKVKESTADEYQLLLDTHLSKWKDHPIDSVSPGDVKRLHGTIGSPSRADAAMRVFRALWNFAWADNIDDATGGSRLKGKNPVDVLSGLGQWNGNKPKSSHVTAGQFASWYAGVMALKPERTSSRVDVVQDLFLFCVYTGVRLGEALNLDDANVDLDAATFRLRNTKNSDEFDFVLPASKPVLAVLKRRCGNGRVFPVERSSLKRYRDQVLDSCGVEFTVHDLRRTFATHARDIGISKALVGELLNHKTGRDGTAGYIAQSAEPYRKPMEQIATHFARLAK